MGRRGGAEQSRLGEGFRGYGVTHVSVGMWPMGNGGVRTKRASCHLTANGALRDRMHLYIWRLVAERHDRTDGRSSL